MEVPNYAGPVFNSDPLWKQAGKTVQFCLPLAFKDRADPDALSKPLQSLGSLGKGGEEELESREVVQRSD